MFTLVNFIIVLILSFIETFAELPEVLSGLYSLFILIPSLAVAVRRLHDTGRSGWWILIGLIPIIGAIILILFDCQDSQENENKYGSNPKVGPIY